ncbi:THAP domain-containing protein 8 isoform X2 [Urocitellus parryii]
MLGVESRDVKFPLKDGPRLEAWLRCMGREHWVPSCHQHLCSEHFTPSCFQWRWGVRYLRPDAVPSIFSRVPPAKSPRRTRSTQKPEAPPPPPPPPAPQEAGLPLESTVAASGPVHVVVLGPASDSAKAASTVLLTPLPLPSAPAGRRTGVSTQHPRVGLGAVLGALQRRVRRLQRRHQRHQAQLQALEQLALQLRTESLQARAHQGQFRVLPGSEESQTFTIICGGPDIAVVLAQDPAPATLDAKPELDTQSPSA